MLDKPLLTRSKTTMLARALLRLLTRKVNRLNHLDFLYRRAPTLMLIAYRFRPSLQ